MLTTLTTEGQTALNTGVLIWGTAAIVIVLIVLGAGGGEDE